MIDKYTPTHYTVNDLIQFGGYKEDEAIIKVITDIEEATLEVSLKKNLQDILIGRLNSRYKEYKQIC